jgi:hypothetical protein
VIYVDNRDMMKIEGKDRRYIGKKNIIMNMIIKYKRKKTEECHHDDRYDD